jgi:hypothetical protein
VPAAGDAAGAVAKGDATGAGAKGDAAGATTGAGAEGGATGAIPILSSSLESSRSLALNLPPFPAMRPGRSNKQSTAPQNRGLKML